MKRFFTPYNIICLALSVLGIVFFLFIGLVPAFLYVSIPLISIVLIMIGVKFYLKYKDVERGFLIKQEETMKFIIDNYGEENLITFNADMQESKTAFNKANKKYIYICIAFIVIAIMLLFIIF